MVKSLKLHRTTLLILFLAAVLRLFLLEIKPPHFDEGVNGWFVDQMTKTGYFHYDPENYHGPLHFYILFLFQTLLGRHIWALRLPVILVSLASIWLVTRFEEFLPRRVCQIAALAMAVSPAEVFYARYAIHEAELAFSLLLTTWGIARLWKEGDRKGLWAIAMGVTGMILTKETYIIHIACFLLTMGCLWVWAIVAHLSRSPRCAPQRWTLTDLGTALGCSLLLVIFFYSGGFLDPSSLKGLYQTYAAWIKTGTHGNGHEKVWHYWLFLIGLFEWPVAVGLIFGVGWAIWGFARECGASDQSDQSDQSSSSTESILPELSTLLLRFLAIYGCGALTAYSLVPYKTPWCIITLIWPFFFLFGYALVAMAARFRPVLPSLLAVPLLGASLGLCVWLNFFHYTDESVPYVYVQTTKEIQKLTDPLFKLIAQDPKNYAMQGHIMIGSYYPLPWVLGDFTQIGYFNADRNPDVMDADFLLVDPDRVEKVESALKQEYFKDNLRLRSGMEASTLFLRASKFKEVFPERTPEFIPK